MKIRYKMLFLGLIVPQVICKGDFQTYLLALSGDHHNSDPFWAYLIKLLMQIRDFRKSLICHFYTLGRKELCPLSQSPLFGVLTVG